MTKNRQLHVLEGSLRPARHDRPTPTPRPVAPRCPSWLDRKAKQKFRELAGPLERAGLLTELDGESFTAYCVAWSLWRRCVELLAKDGVLVEGHRKAQRKHPALMILRQAESTLLTVGQRFGLDPSSRGRMSLPPPDSEELQRERERMLD